MIADFVGVAFERSVFARQRAGPFRQFLEVLFRVPDGRPYLVESGPRVVLARRAEVEFRLHRCPSFRCGRAFDGGGFPVAFGLGRSFAVSLQPCLRPRSAVFRVL